MTKHTPIPWRADLDQHKTYDGEVFPKDGHVTIMTDNGNCDWEIAQLHKFSGGDGMQKQNAEFIVRACNNFEKLISLLCDAHDHLVMYSPVPKSDALIIAIKKAVADAEEK